MKNWGGGIFVINTEFGGPVVRVPRYRSIILGVDSQRHQIFKKGGLEGVPRSLVRIIQELLERKSKGFGLENQD
jgi:hypothetical protein